MNKRKQTHPVTYSQESYSTKKQKVEAEDLYHNGAITYIHLENFNGHREFEWIPGPKVNILTGVGKSSILNAIRIGLDYKYNAKSLKKYVGDEASEAVITIHLYNGFSASSVSVPDYRDEFHPRPNVYGNNFIKFRTVIKKDGRKSLNMSANEYEEIMKQFQINVSNPHVIHDQENAKDYFSNQEPRFLYEFLMKLKGLEFLHEENENYNFENMSLENRNIVSLYNREIRRNFQEILREFEIEGELILCLEKKNMGFAITRRKTDEKISSIRCQLRICLLMSVWQFQKSPFTAIDDNWKFLLDDQQHDRKKIAEMLLQRATRWNRQFFFVFPRDSLPNNSDIRFDNDKLIYGENRIWIKDILEENYKMDTRFEHEYDDNSVGTENSENPDTEDDDINSDSSENLDTENDDIDSDSSENLDTEDDDDSADSMANSNPLEQKETNQLGTLNSVTSVEPIASRSKSLNKICDDIEQIKKLADNLNSAQLKNLLKTDSEKNEADSREIKALNVAIKVLSKEHASSMKKCQAEMESLRNQNQILVNGLDQISDDNRQMSKQVEKIQKSILKEKEAHRLEIKALNETIENQSKENSSFMENNQEEVNHLENQNQILEDRLSILSTEFDAQEIKCKELSTALQKSQEELKDMKLSDASGLSSLSTKLRNLCNDQKISLEKSREEISSLKETLDEKVGKLKLQTQMTDITEKQINTLMNLVLPNDGSRKTFLELREEIEYLKGTHSAQKEQIEILQNQLENCQ